MEIKLSIGAIVLRKRIAKKWTQEKLSSKAVINIRFLQKIEAGDRIPSLATVFKLAEAFGVEPDELLMPVWKEWIKS